MRFIIVTGMSGAGRTQASHCMEDMGYYCIDNLPPVLIDKFADICGHSQGKLEKVALVMDLRGGYLFEQLTDELENLKLNGYEYEILFLDSNEETLIKRYKETRRKHPLASEGSILEGIRREREILSQIKAVSDYIIDTSNMTLGNLKKKMEELFSCGENKDNFHVEVESFGFKFGMALDADLVFDVRFLPNPYYVEELKKKTGTDKEVCDYVFGEKVTWEFCEKLSDMMDFLIPKYMEEGKNNLVVAIGCTGGKHRSVAVAEHLASYLKENGNNVVVTHRDIDR
ncbi:MAG: RNase adapter RapZ [Clostridia bacterium]|nr:RNase adapter RapZ [Clostridia bacterium]